MIGLERPIINKRIRKNWMIHQDWNSQRAQPLNFDITFVLEQSIHYIRKTCFEGQVLFRLLTRQYKTNPTDQSSKLSRHDVQGDDYETQKPKYNHDHNQKQITTRMPKPKLAKCEVGSNPSLGSVSTHKSSIIGAYLLPMVPLWCHNPIISVVLLVYCNSLSISTNSWIYNSVLLQLHHLDSKISCYWCKQLWSYEANHKTNRRVEDDHIGYLMGKYRPLPMELYWSIQPDDETHLFSGRAGL